MVFRLVTLLAPLLQALADGDFSYDTLDGVDRYMRFDDHPKPLDKERAILAGGDVKCRVCEIILGDIMDSIRRTSDRDAILEALEADEVTEEEIEKAPTDMLKHVAKKKRGCNRLFKDRFFAKGWDLVWDVKLMDGQTKADEFWKHASWAYVKHTEKVPNVTEINTYSADKEAVHYACENTLAKYRDEVASFLAKQAKAETGIAMKDLIAEACVKKAKCEKRNAKEAVEIRSKLAEDGFKSRQQLTMELFLKEEREKKRAEKAEKKKKKQEKKAEKEAKRRAKEAAKEKGGGGQKTDL
jgi:hypothetical protein